MEFEPLDIENGVIEFDEMRNSNGEDDSERPSDYYDHVLPDNSRNFETLNGDPNLEPFEGMEFDSEQAARIFYNSYARRIGFSTRVSVYQRSRRDGSIICRQIVCSREGFRRGSSENRSKRQRTITRVGCKAQMTVKKQGSGKWAVSKLIKEHNHELVPPDKVHCLRSHRHVSGPARSLIDTLQAAGMGPSGVMSVLIKESGGVNNVGFTKVDCQNYMSSSRQRTLGSGGQVVIDNLKQMQAEDPSFFCAFQGTRHRFCKWNVFREAQERLSDVYQSHPHFEAEFQRKIFMKFQEELVETLAYPATIVNDTGSEIIYRVAKFGEEQKAHFVRHILAVFRVTNILTLPSHYILKRWTRNAKSGVLLNGHVLGLASSRQESSAARYDNLCREVIKYVEEGAESAHIYNMAMDVLREAAKKVAAAKKYGPGVTQNSLFSGCQQHHSCSVDQDKKIQELTVELENASQRCEAYRTKLLAVLKDMEEEKTKMLVKVENVRLDLKDFERVKRKEKKARMVMDAFEKLEKVGEGTYGKVYRAREKATGKIVALKKTRLHEDDEGVPPTTLREVSILRMLSRDPHVVRLMDVKQGQNKEGRTVLYLVFEYMDTDLKKYIRSFRQTGENIPVNTVKSLMYQLCKGVAFCHGHGILHRDLKPHNLLMDRKTMTLKIADLGLARAFTLPIKKYTHEILTLWYRAPEVLLGSTHYSTAVDMWSVACIFAELVTKTALFPGDSELQQLLHIFRLLGTPNEKVWPGVSSLMNWHEYPQWNPQSLATAVPNLDKDGLDLLEQMLQYDPSKRISAKKAMEHPYFDDLDKTRL
ncbi:hypothetical protein WN943_009272 [Citrus x changshan-huyou]